MKLIIKQTNSNGFDFFSLIYLFDQIKAIGCKQFKTTDKNVHGQYQMAFTWMHASLFNLNLVWLV